MPQSSVQVYVKNVHALAFVFHIMSIVSPGNPLYIGMQFKILMETASLHQKPLKLLTTKESYYIE